MLKPSHAPKGALNVEKLLSWRGLPREDQWRSLPKEADTALLAALRAEGSLIRKQRAMAGLSIRKSPGAVEALLPLLNAKELSLRRGALRALIHSFLDQEPVWNAAQQSLEDPDLQIRISAIKALSPYQEQKQVYKALKERQEREKDPLVLEALKEALNPP